MFAIVFVGNEHEIKRRLLSGDSTSYEFGRFSQGKDQNQSWLWILMCPPHR